MLVKPLCLVAEYSMNFDYIVNVLCENKDKPEMQCDGKCYLDEQLSKQPENSDKNPFGDNRVLTKVQPSVFFEPTDPMDFEIDFLSYDSDSFKNSQVFVATLFTSDISHPDGYARLERHFWLFFSNQVEKRKASGFTETGRLLQPLPRRDDDVPQRST